METVLLLVVIAGVAAVFVWLRRTIGDDWPPPEPEEGATLSTSTTIRNGAALAEDHLPPTTVLVATGPVIPSVAPAAAVPLTVYPRESAEIASAAFVPRPAELHTELPPDDRSVEVQPTVVVAEPTVVVARTLLLGGGALLLGTLITTSAVPAGQRGGLLLLVLIGAGALLLGTLTVMRGRLPGWLGGLLGRVGGFLSVTHSQAAMLLMALPFAFLARLAAGNDWQARQPAIAALAWLIAIALAVGGSVSRETSADAPRRAFDRWDWLLMGGLFILALLLRGVATTQFPGTYSGDEGSAGLFGVILLNGQANNPFTVGWFSFPSLYFVVQSIAIGLGGQTVEAVRLTSAVAGALSVVAVYALGRSMFDRTTAVLAAAYLAGSHFHIHMSRIALNNVWDGLFGTVAIAGLWSGWKTGRRGAFILCGLALGLGQYFYVAIRVLPVLFLIWAAVAWWRQREQFRLRLPGLIVAAGVALVVFLPLGLYFADKPDEFQAPLNRVTIFGTWLENELALGQRSAVEIIADQALAGAMGFTHEPLRLLYNPGSPLLLAGAATLFILGVLWALIHFDLRYLLLILPLLASIAANAVSQDSPASQRFVLVMPIVALFVALPLGEAVAWAREHRPQYQRVVVAAVAALLAIVILIDLNYYFNEVPDTYVLGGGNTAAATAIAYTLRDEDPPAQDVYFFGFPRMGYFSLSTISFLAPQMRGQDVIEPLTEPPAWPLAGPTLFVFLPERLAELPLVEQSFPDGRYEEFHSPSGELLFAVYAVS